MATRRKEIFDFAIAQLEAGLLPSNLPARLMALFSLLLGYCGNIAQIGLTGAKAGPWGHPGRWFSNR